MSFVINIMTLVVRVNLHLLLGRHGQVQHQALTITFLCYCHVPNHCWTCFDNIVEQTLILAE